MPENPFFRKERDIQEYKEALEDLLVQLREGILHKCRAQARRGCYDLMEDITDSLRTHWALGSKLGRNPAWTDTTDPIMRGWYLANAPADVLECPPGQALQSETRGPAAARFREEVLEALAGQLREMGLTATWQICDDHCHWAIVSWGPDTAA